MNKKCAMFVGMALALASGAGVLWFSRQSEASTSVPAPISASTVVAPADKAHEIASLEGELKKKTGHGPILQRVI
jgi:hypothetical protein